MSRTRCSRRPWATATTPHRGHPVTDSEVSTNSSSSPPYSPTASTTNPEMPSIAAGRTVASTLTWDSSRSVAWSLRIVESQARLHQPNPVSASQPGYHAW
ncbi:hypothetical protein [uncultured Corynebacterium sp.]|uniref:hypothetical protein n=1 Tax=uncultured Corynebacterium sp. TaxID=159447 RepID=UPI001D0D44F8|nr:hypothetical protein [Corynebacterium aurimucosum]